MVKSEKQLIWEERIEKQLASGLTQRQWCEENNLALSAYRYWKLRIDKENRRTDHEEQEQTDETVDFAGIIIAPETAPEKSLLGPPKGIEIRISDAIITIPSDFSENHLGIVNNSSVKTRKEFSKPL
jgi:hypothetical protein